mmetsp:Transcript_46494/g.97282  ORF Transcript_46494/g.97282 Transcript_46494/m.97282 type:complete len:226 (-) Transcript_46494:15-692(-)
MGSAESVVDVHVERSSELLRERLVVLLLLRVETNILKEAALAILQVIDDLRGLLADAILGNNAALAEELGKSSTARGKGILVLRTTLGASKMGRDGNTGTVVQKILDGRNRCTDAGVVSDLLAIKGHVEVAANEDLLALEILAGEVRNGLLLRGSSHHLDGLHTSAPGSTIGGAQAQVEVRRARDRSRLSQPSAEETRGGDVRRSDSRHGQKNRRPHHLHGGSFF